jgi:hypothetical protein
MYNVKFPQGCPWLIFRHNMVQEGEIIVFFKAAQNSTIVVIELKSKWTHFLC